MTAPAATAISSSAGASAVPAGSGASWPTARSAGGAVPGPGLRRRSSNAAWRRAMPTAAAAGALRPVAADTVPGRDDGLL